MTLVYPLTYPFDTSDPLNVFTYVFFTNRQTEPITSFAPFILIFFFIYSLSQYPVYSLLRRKVLIPILD